MSIFDQAVERRAYAKINLRLKVEGRLENGFHSLSMLNCLIDLHDTITIQLTRRKEITLQVSFDGIPEDRGLIAEGVEGNLMGRAAQALFAEYSFTGGVHLSLIKRIPIGAGLGGGSSDAAAVLGVLDDALKQEKLVGAHEPYKKRGVEELAAALGSDIPFFLSQPFCHVTGIGELVSALPEEPLRDYPCILCFPHCSVQTAQAYKLLTDLAISARWTKDVAGRAFAQKALSGDYRIDDLFQLVDNDFNLVVPKAFPQIDAALQQLRTLPHAHVGLSGSGSALFVIPHKPDNFSTILSAVQKAGISAITTRLSPAR